MGTKRHRAFVIAMGVAAAIALVGGTIAWSLVTAPCIPRPASVGYPGFGRHYCPLPAGPGPTTFIARGTTFVVGPGENQSMSVVPSPATDAILTGNFSATTLTTVYVMSPGEFANYSKGSRSFSCPLAYECWTTGSVQRGTVDVASLPVYLDPSNGLTVEPWYIVMHDANATSATSITWTSNLTAVYEEIYVALPAGSPGPALVASTVGG